MINLFGEVVDQALVLNIVGRVVDEQWRKTAEIRPNVELDEYVIMPNHMHGIIIIYDDGRDTTRRVPTAERFGKPVAGSLPTIVRAFKAAVTKRINLMRNTSGLPIWQRNYHEHIIRNDRSLNRIRGYIAGNPLQWHLDNYNPESGSSDEVR